MRTNRNLTNPATRAALAKRKRSWRTIGLNCLSYDNLRGFHIAYRVGRNLRWGFVR